MPGRHSAPSSATSSRGFAKYVVVAVVLLLVVGGGAFVALKAFGSACGDTQSYSLAADPAIAPVLEQIVDNTSAEDLGCAGIEVTATESGQVSAAVAKGDDVPSLWVPDSSLWIGKTVRSTASLIDLASQSIAGTPAVLAARKDEVPFFDTWLTALKLEGLRIGNPLANTTSDAAILGAVAEAGSDEELLDAVGSALVPIAQAQAATRGEADPTVRLDDLVADGGVAVVSEQAFLAYQQDTGVELGATVPPTGTISLNFPLAVTEPAGDRHETAKSVGTALAAAIESDRGQQALSDGGFRSADMAPLDADRGIGDVTPLTIADQQAAESTLRQYQVLALPSRTLVMEDVSGSMNYSAGADSRIALTVQASETGNRLFPDNASMGLWAFSIGLGGESQDYRELAPIRRMDEKVGNTTQREVLLQQTRTLPTLVGGGTGLYDTTLAAFRSVQEGYDPDAVNSVIILTDGTNEDPASISLDELLSTLRAEQDPSKPVVIVTIGITDDADAGVLQQISAATGGTSFVARNPAEIPNVFVNALRSRSGR
ncbi:substrate-binding and VWA domain-containing protein [Rhodococcus sp. ARC_M12]|uniref:substrate-binding and VWA domain-containing protein n=1 Tax=unclassified Rhodococcus (in: high G+C Gram-positive bacteria) TaxID=192944 RepID=UPI001FB372E2|nr:MULTISPECIES: substrate-binding and VWA domain-containing protein [unclassified Rhodococcus (in: high G+C Gram-positive bacteria)]MCJ0891796.1 substrate-binding and VWA domain-containing protein [Rhodococcus sp. ARC_M5]MCJ0976865.1 substrate-binding and VWA domain-containing protein [Rhodococcus sp. ARC_M12]